MNRLECLGKSSTGSQKQVAVDVTSARAETHKPNDKVGKKTVTDKPRRSLPARAPPRPAQVSCQERPKSGISCGEVQNVDACPPKDSINTTPSSALQRAEEQAQSTAEPAEELEMKNLRNSQPPDSAPAGASTTQHCPPPVKPLPTHEEEEQTEDAKDPEDKDMKAPVELIMEFLIAVMGKDFQVASKLCQMILIFEPDHPKASQFLPLIQKKLSEEQEAEENTEEDEEEEDDDEEDDDSESDEESSQSSSCSNSSCSSSSPSDDDEEVDEEEEEKRGSRHKPCPPSH